MSTRYNTGNPIESTDVRDMSDNAKNFDEFSNSSADTFTDRFGGARKTINGMNSEFDAQILNMGYSRIGTFSSGATLVNARQTLLWDIADGGDGHEYGWAGAFPKVVQPGSTPSSTGGVGYSAWVDRSDVTLRSELASAGGAGLIGPGVMTKGVDKFSIMQGREGEYRQDTLTRGLAVELDEPITGSGFVGATNTYMFNRFRVKDDRVDAVNDGTPGTKVDGLIVQHNFGGPGTRGGRHAGEFMLTQKGVTESDNTDRHYVGVVGYSVSQSGDGGTPDAPIGNYFGSNMYVALQNAPNTGHANGCESNVSIDSNSSTKYRC